MIIEVTDANFDETIQKKDFVLVDFWAPWCGPCKRIAPILKEIDEKMQGKIDVAKVNVDENPESAAKYKIVSIPTITIFRKGELKDNLIGLLPKSTYIKKIEEYL